MSHRNVKWPPWTNGPETWSPAGGTFFFFSFGRLLNIQEVALHWRKWVIGRGSWDLIAWLSTSCFIWLPDPRHMWPITISPSCPNELYFFELQADTYVSCFESGIWSVQEEVWLTHLLFRVLCLRTACCLPMKPGKFTQFLKLPYTLPSLLSNIV